LAPFGQSFVKIGRLLQQNIWSHCTDAATNIYAECKIFILALAYFYSNINKYQCQIYKYRQNSLFVHKLLHNRVCFFLKITANVHATTGQAELWLKSLKAEKIAIT